MEQNYLLNLARRAIQKYLKGKSALIIEPDSLPSDSLKDKRGVFVTLTINDELRGCIGNLEPEKPIYQAVIDNSLAAAFCDPRFPPVGLTELNKIKIEISILSPLKKLEQFNSIKDLLSYLDKNKPGLLIQKGYFKATFLPQVWNDLTNPEDFLSQLCLKAELPSNEWQKGGLEIFEYQVEKFEEENIAG